MKITALFAWVVEDGDGEGVPAIQGKGGLMIPLMGADPERAMSLKHFAQQTADETGKPVRLLKSTELVEVEVVHPQHDMQPDIIVDAESYQIIERRGGARGFKCKLCGMTSWNPNDTKNTYCGFCHDFHE